MPYGIEICSLPGKHSYMKCVNQKCYCTLTGVVIIMMLFPMVFSSGKADEEKPARIMIYIDDSVFTPSVGILPGSGIVIWQNNDTIPHTLHLNGTIIADKIECLSI